MRPLFFVFEHKDNAAVAFLQFAKLLLEGEEQVLVETPVQECANAVDFLDCEYRKFAYLSERLVKRCNRAVFGVRVNEHVNDFAFDKREFVAVAGEEHAAASFKFQVIALRGDRLHACAVNSSKFHNLPFRSGIPQGGGKVADIRDMTKYSYSVGSSLQCRIKLSVSFSPSFASFLSKNSNFL